MDQAILEKHCCQCDKTKPIVEFYKPKYSYCIECMCKNSREWRANNLEKAKEKDKKRWAENKEAEKARKKKYRDENPEKAKEAWAAYSEENREDLNAKQRARNI